MTTPGVRRHDGTSAHEFLPGEYAKTLQGIWIVRPPENAKGISHSGTLSKHTVEEHEDGTITVTPSILQQYGDGEELWHGFLRHGQWETV